MSAQTLRRLVSVHYMMDFSYFTSSLSKLPCFRYYTMAYMHRLTSGSFSHASMFQLVLVCVSICMFSLVCSTPRTSVVAHLRTLPLQGKPSYRVHDDARRLKIDVVIESHGSGFVQVRVISAPLTQLTTSGALRVPLECGAVVS